ncbi:MAG: hypothetical protein QM606_08750 [Leucobacter sp.]
MKIPKTIAVLTVAVGLGAGALIAAPGTSAQATVLYQFEEYKGLDRNIGVGYVANLGTFDNKTSSLIVGANQTASLYQFADYKGYHSSAFYHYAPDLNEWFMPNGQTWDNRTSSVW